ncbi:MAG: MBL fold metallo-hydrolase [Candidatus Hermodarchaeota archaeon]
MNSEKYYEIIQQKDYLIIIREKFDEIEPRFFTTYTNLYLIIGKNECLLIDTGCGLFPLKPVIDKFLNEKKLNVVNTHSHWDHIGANGEFENVFIHKKEKRLISKPLDLSFLKNAPNTIVNRYSNINLILLPAKRITPLNGGEIFDLGGIDVEIIHNAGHSPGSISLYTDKGELFPGDLVRYGMILLPSKENFTPVINSLKLLINLCNKEKITELYPSHDEYNISKNSLTDLFHHLENIDDIWENRKPDEFNNAWIIKINEFLLMINVGIKEREDFKKRLNLIK